MTRDLDLIKQGIDALNRSDLDGMLATVHPDVAFEPLRAILDGTVYHGHDGFRAWMADMTEDWEEYRIELVGIRELASGEVLVDARLHVRYRGSGVEVDSPGAWLCDFRDGLVARIRFYRDAESALAAAAPGA